MPSSNGSSPAVAQLSGTKIGVLIRFSNSAETLPDVLTALQRQTLLPNVILGVDSGSHDHSRALIEAAGGRVIQWEHRYEHARVLNFGLRHLGTDLVLILSSHTVLEDSSTLARMAAAMADPDTACVSLKWDSDPFYSDAIDWRELQHKGLKFGSIYSNSMGMIRRSLWEQQPFDESLATAEDYAWAIAQLKSGRTCRRFTSSFSYQRSGNDRAYDFARIVFRLAQQHHLPVAWLGLRGTLTAWLRTLFRKESSRSLHYARLLAYFRAQLTLAT